MDPNKLLNSTKPTVITVDGPSGSGKGTISLMLAKKLGWHFLDSGALYRALAIYLINEEKINNNLDLKKLDFDEDVLENLALKLPIKFVDKKIFLDDGLKYNNQEITQTIRSENCGNLASKLAIFSRVRRALLVKQHQFLREPGLVADGRDMGTVVFPEAIIKFFLEADLETRAKRRLFQLKQLGVDGNLQNLIAEISERDFRDRQRIAAPLVPARDAITIDTASMTINEVFAIVMSKVKDGLII